MPTLQLLIRLPGLAMAPDEARAWTARHVGARARPRVLHAVDEALTYLKLALDEPPGVAALAQWLDAAQAATPGAETALLRNTLSLPGASAGQDAPWHYIVETDVAPGAEAELNAWYEREHLPGLAAVPGTALAERYLDAAGSPRHHACYDLHTRAAFGSPPWLAVRATDWSSRVRPHFRHTRRTMFRVAG